LRQKEGAVQRKRRKRNGSLTHAPELAPCSAAYQKDLRPNAVERGRKTIVPYKVCKAKLVGDFMYDRKEQGTDYKKMPDMER